MCYKCILWTIKIIHHYLFFTWIRDMSLPEFSNIIYRCLRLPSPNHANLWPYLQSWNNLIYSIFFLKLLIMWKELKWFCKFEYQIFWYLNSQNQTFSAPSFTGILGFFWGGGGYMKSVVAWPGYNIRCTGVVEIILCKN